MRLAVGRLTRRPDFLRVAGGGRKWVTPGLILQVRQHTSAGEARAHDAGLRVGLTVSRKVGRAVERNRARRRLRAVADRVMPAHAEPGQDYVLIARRETTTRPFAALIADLETALRRLGAWRSGDGADGTAGKEQEDTGGRAR